MLNLSPVAVRITDSNRRVLYANTAYRELIEIQGTLDNIDPWDYYTNKNDYREILDEIERGKQVRNKLLQISVYDRGDKWVLASYARIEHYGENAVLGWFYDITDRLQSEESLRLHASVFDNAWEAIIISDADNHIITVNNAFTAITGFSLEDIKGQNPCFLCSELRGEEFYKTMWKTVTEEGQWHGEIWSKKKNGDIFAQRTSVSAVRNPQSDITHYVTVFNDISDIKEKESKLRALAHYDALTGLPNRVLLADRLAQCIANTRRNNKLLLVCFLDLDGFKAINDHHGHDVGDKLLIEIATRLENTVRKGDTVARLGGDEFVVLLNSVNQHDEIDVLLCRINDVIAKPVQIDEHQHHVSGSIGVTIYPNDDSDTDTLLRHADLAMYEAKQAGRNRYHIFDATLDLEIHQKHQDVVRIAQALAAN
jgi:diguanylate cyclase (GGDEF)-like protein/PAS domain S-box-containing protein